MRDTREEKRVCGPLTRPWINTIGPVAQFWLDWATDGEGTTRACNRDCMTEIANKLNHDGLRLTALAGLYADIAGVSDAWIWGKLLDAGVKSKTYTTGGDNGTFVHTWVAYPEEYYSIQESELPR